MANINNSQLSKELIDGAKIQTSFDKIPTQLADKVVPVMEVNPKLLRCCNFIKEASCINATTTTIYTTPTNKDFFLTALHLSVIKDVTSTSTRSYVNAYVNGVVNSLITIAGITLTVQDQNCSISFPIPIKIDRGTAIALNNSSATANVTSRASIMGYLDE